MNFYEWLLSIDPNRNWERTKGFEALEKQIVEAVRSGQSINLREIFSQFAANEAPGYGDDNEDADKVAAEPTNKNLNIN